MAEKRDFKMHPKLLYDVIRRQAGSLAKAILEGVMNMVDAGATEGHITIEPKKVALSDNGKGFASREEVETWFEVFGQPHEESENKTYGTFRMGRGQMFAFGYNTWVTGKFRMVVDFKNNGTEYQLDDKQKNVSGCEINIGLYEELMPSDIQETITSLEQWCKYAPIPIYINGRQITTDPANARWGQETDEAYIRLKEHGNLEVYNLGIHVLSLSGWKYGRGGVIVSKKQLKVNFARNDIQSDCDVWKKIKPVVDELCGREISKKKALNEDERQRLVDQLLTGQRSLSALRDQRLITASTGRQYALSVFQKSYRWPQFTSGPAGDRAADRLMKSKTAFVVSDDTLDRFHVKSLRELIDKLITLEDASYHDWDLKLVDFEELTKDISGDHLILTSDELSPNEKLWLAAMKKGQGSIHISENRRACYRKLHIGESEVADGWTDGSTYIAINRKYLKSLNFTIRDLTWLGNLLLHEMCHVTADLVAHAHDQEFYERFHDNADSVGRFVTVVFSGLPQLVKSHKKKLTSKTLQDCDRIAGAEKALASLK